MRPRRWLRFAELVLRHGWLPVQHLVLNVLGLSVLGGVTLALHQDPLIVAAAVGAGLLLILVGGSYRAWDEAACLSAALQGNTPLQEGIAELLSDGREIRSRLHGARDKDLEEVGFELWAWARDDVYNWLNDRIGATELALEWHDEMPALDTVTLVDFMQEIGPTRGNLLAHVERGLRLLASWQERLRA